MVLSVGGALQSYAQQAPLSSGTIVQSSPTGKDGVTPTAAEVSDGVKRIFQCYASAFDYLDATIQEDYPIYDKYAEYILKVGGFHALGKKAKAFCDDDQIKSFVTTHPTEADMATVGFHKIVDAFQDRLLQRCQSKLCKDVKVRLAN
jgi:hypothetical protein